MTGLVTSGLLFAAYAWCVLRCRARFPDKLLHGARILFFGLGCAGLGLALSPPFDALADKWFAWHMGQHLLLMLVAAPLLLLGAPLLYVLGALPSRVARAAARAFTAQPLRTLLSPVAAWLAYVAVLWTTHFSGLYNAALENAAVHAFEHALYLGAALLFWSAVVQTGFVAHPLPFAARLLYVFLAIPQGAFVGLALYQTRGVLYAHYAAGVPASQALAGQHDAGALMWIGGGLAMFAAFLITAAAWAAAEREKTELGFVA